MSDSRRKRLELRQSSYARAESLDDDLLRNVARRANVVAADHFIQPCTHTHKHKHAHTHTRAHAHTHTRIHTHTHTHMLC